MTGVGGAQNICRHAAQHVCVCMRVFTWWYLHCPQVHLQLRRVAGGATAGVARNFLSVAQSPIKRLLNKTNAA